MVPPQLISSKTERHSVSYKRAPFGDPAPFGLIVNPLAGRASAGHAGEWEAGYVSDHCRHRLHETKEPVMNILLIVVIIVAIVLAITGGLVQSLNFLLWVGIVLAVIAVIAWLIRMITGSRRA